MELPLITEHLKHAYGITADSVEPIGDGVTNQNFRIKNERGEFIFKIYSFKSVGHVSYEAKALSILAEHNFPSPRLIKGQSGEVIEFDGRPSVLYPMIEGETKSGWSAPEFARLGLYIGELHTILKDFDNPLRQGTFDPEVLKKTVAESRAKFDEAGYGGTDALLSFLESELAEVKLPALPTGFTHSDIKPENVLFEDEMISGFVDFDIGYVGMLLNDLTTPLVWAGFDGTELNTDKANALIAGYQTKRKLTAEERASFMDALHYRIVREAFNSPYDVLPRFMDKTLARSREFMRTADAFKKVKDTVKVSFA